ncbi:MAG: hypothetical protein B7Y90_06035 [Alphaproteobacteria bacterium 32-64-14]|nr:MAG: hypothetical protein B7Y90_06035 [Alphaproteobacteria bacterium 32-64-14]
MRMTAFAAFLMLTACDQAPASDPLPAPPVVEAGAETTQAPVAVIEGWETDTSAYALIGATLPAFAAKHADGRDFASDVLRGRWTILGVTGAEPLSKDETTHAAAASSAADQDPNLDFLVVSVADAGALKLAAFPAYLLVGPDLTIEAYRGALSSTPRDGIKPVFRGVAEIRKQVSAPN